MQIAETGIFDCSQPECSIATTGRCVNGLDIQDCPNKKAIVKEDITVETDNEAIQERKPSSTVHLGWGYNFSEQEVSQLTYKYPCKLIILIGEPSYGKSTLYGALFDSFHKGGCGNYIFSCTRTPLGFEEICHYAREKSKGKVAKTERTKSFQFTYLHLGVREKCLSKQTEHLIFADVNGERFQAAKDSDEEVLKLRVLKRADHVFFVADGGLLLDDGEKHVVKNDVWKIICRCVQNNMLSENQLISIIITKWDEVHAAGKIKDIEDFFITPTMARFPSLLTNVIRVASRSINDEVPPRTGVDDFLKSCLSSYHVSKEKNYTPAIKREYQRFKYDIR